MSPALLKQQQKHFFRRTLVSGMTVIVSDNEFLAYMEEFTINPTITSITAWELDIRKVCS
ncbi:hypothetical protein J2X14_003810 [Pantoea alhagi]|nr:hypothetical protein [Pantoea alhagi]